jgi:murein DD-endopeptidase MepM/ murein hydrolase activator NlpD
VVTAGQTLWRIARAYGLRVDELAGTNGLDDPTRIEVGRRLWIPGATNLLEVPPAGAAPGADLGPGTFMWPVRGSVSSGFGARSGRRHAGIDIRAPSGTPVRASRDGLVAYSGSRFRGYGNLVILDHGDNVSTYYAHNSSNLVEEGQQVRQGDRIARVGRTGNASGPHLHFEIRRGNVLLDPLKHLPSPS